MITLTTDIGWSYAAQVKGVIYSIHPSSLIVDITHDIPPQDVRSAAFTLMTSVEHFPSAVHVCIVDPGVGSERRGLLIVCGGHRLLGPDNGVLIPAARRLGIEETYAIPRSLEEGASRTFHGRDVFAPLAARIDAGEDMTPFLERMAQVVDLDFGTPTFTERGVRSEAIYVDRFGNIVTNIRFEDISDLLGHYEKVIIRVGDDEHPARPAATYSEGGGILLLRSSSGYVEIAESCGNAAQRLGISPGMDILVRYP